VDEPRADCAKKTQLVCKKDAVGVQKTDSRSCLKRSVKSKKQAENV